MSKRDYFGTNLDRIYGSRERRVPGYRVFVWNPNRCDIQDVVMNRAASPRYDVTSHVKKIDYDENIVFENNDDAVATHCTITFAYDPNAQPIPISERTLLDGTPVRIYQGDLRVPLHEWICIFTGVIRGNPSVVVYDRDNAATTGREVQVLVVDRAEKYLNKIATGRNYAQGDDIGKAAVETAIEFMYLDRREIDIGHQNYAIGHTQSQIVDIEVLKGIHQILQCVGKKPRFDALGKLVAADTNLSRVPVRIYPTRDLFASITRTQQGGSMYNTVKMLGLDNELTEVRERRKRLAHGEISSGWFDSVVRDEIYFSESTGTSSGGRKARDTELHHKLHAMGGFGADITWTPYMEDDGYTCFGGDITLDTGFAPWVPAALTGTYVAFEATRVIGIYAGDPDIEAAGSEGATITLVGLLVAMQCLGRVTWEVWGYPVQNVFQQLCSTAQLSTVLTEDIKELEIRNDWIYDITVLGERAKEHLKRELIKAHSYEIVMADDPLLEVDDIIQIVDDKYYVTSIRKVLARPGDGLMSLTAWRMQ